MTDCNITKDYIREKKCVKSNKRVSVYVALSTGVIDEAMDIIRLTVLN